MDESSNRLYVVMERGDTDFASFLTRNADSINTRFIHFYWEQMLRAVKVIHDQSMEVFLHKLKFVFFTNLDIS